MFTQGSRITTRIVLHYQVLKNKNSYAKHKKLPILIIKQF